MIDAARDGGVYVVNVTTTSQSIDLSSAAAAEFKAAIAKGIPFLIQADPNTVYYRGSNQGTAGVSPSATINFQPAMQAGFVPGGSAIPITRLFPIDTNAIGVVTATGASMVRFVRCG